MATAGGTGTRFSALTERLDRYGVDWVHLAVVDVVVLALAARLYDLGGRVAHWDEARVAYWILDYVRTGNFEYRPIIHGPFYHHVNAAVFETLGASDFSMRLVVAVVCGLFPLVALLLRHRLRDVEVVALAVFLAANPVLLYYSRFMRGDPLVAAFMVTAFALFVYAIDTESRPAFFAGVAFTALGFTVKENALLYVATWAGATVLLLDHRLFRAADGGQRWTAVAAEHARRTGRAVRAWLPAIAVGAVEFVAIIAFFYAPRGQTEAGPGLDQAMADPSLLPAVVQAGTIGAAAELWDLWVAGGRQDHAYLPYLAHYVETLGHGALAVCLFAVVGFVADRYREGGPSDLASFAFYWGFASALGYPIVTDIKAPWVTIHAVVPLAIPAAVGLGLVVRWGYGAYVDGDTISAGLTALIVLLVFGQIAGVAFTTVYANPQSESNQLVQYAQPAGDVHPVTERLSAAAADGGEGPDVLFHGEYFVDGDAAVPREPACVKWFNSLPLPWYVERTDADVACAEDRAAVASTVEESQPPVIVTRQSNAARLRTELDDYEERTYRLRAWGTKTAFFVRESYADGVPESTE